MWLEGKGCEAALGGFGSPCHQQDLPSGCALCPLPRVRLLEPLLQSFRAALRLIVECLLSLPGRH